MGKLLGKRLLRRSRRRWDVNIEMSLNMGAKDGRWMDWLRIVPVGVLYC
jgi:hypothetical protein